MRESTNYPGDYTLCVSCEGKVEHYRIIYSSSKLSIDEEVYFENLMQLVEVGSRGVGTPPHPWRCPRLCMGPWQPELVGGSQPAAGGFKVLSNPTILWLHVWLMRDSPPALTRGEEGP